MGDANDDTTTKTTTTPTDNALADAGTEQKKRGRKPGSKVKVKGGAVIVKGPRKTKLSHGWFIQAGLTKNGTSRWSGELELQAKSVKTAVREAKDIVAKNIEAAVLGSDETYSARIFEVKYQNLDVRSIPQKPKVVL